MTSKSCLYGFNEATNHTVHASNHCAHITFIYSTVEGWIHHDIYIYIYIYIIFIIIIIYNYGPRDVHSKTLSQLLLVNIISTIIKLIIN